MTIRLRGNACSRTAWEVVVVMWTPVGLFKISMLSGRTDRVWAADTGDTDSLKVFMRVDFNVALGMDAAHHSGDDSAVEGAGDFRMV